MPPWAAGLICVKGVARAKCNSHASSTLRPAPCAASNDARAAAPSLRDIRGDALGQSRDSLDRWFSELGADQVAQVGGKNASLGEMYRELTPQGVRVPNGFAITAQAYHDTLERAGAWPRLREALAGLDARDVDDLARRARQARDIVQGAPLPPDLVGEIADAHDRLLQEYGEQASFAIRSSATAEDLPSASFAGQHETFLNITGRARLLDAVRMCFASLFKDRAISYRVDQGFDHFKVFQSVGVMKMVRSDRAASGVIFTLDTETGFRDRRAHHRRVRPGRERRAGHGRSR